MLWRKKRKKQDLSHFYTSLNSATYGILANQVGVIPQLIIPDIITADNQVFYIWDVYIQTNNS